MTVTQTDMERAHLRHESDGLPFASSKPRGYSDFLARRQLPAAGARPRSRSSRPWMRAALLALLAILSIAVGYWYVTGVQVTIYDDPNLHVGDNRPVTAGQLVDRLNPLQPQIAFENAKTDLRA